MFIFNRCAFGYVMVFAAVYLTGCAAATAVADLNQKPPTTTLLAKASPDKVFTATVQAMGAFGKVLSQDRASGVVQGEKGNWVLNTGIVPASPGSRIAISARYVPSNKMDFNSRDALTKELIGLIETNLGEKLKIVP